MPVKHLVGVSLKRLCVRMYSLLLGELLFEKTTQIARQLGNVELALLPCYICGPQRIIVWFSVFPDPFRHDFLSGQQFALLQAKQVVARSSCGSPVTFNERVNPVEPP